MIHLKWVGQKRTADADGTLAGVLRVVGQRLRRKRSGWVSKLAEA
jgi:hypothetical protein